MRNRRTWLQQTGAALVECAITMPVLVFFVSGLFEVSRILNELTWASNTAYQLASVLAGSQKPQGLVRMPLRLGQIVSDYKTDEFPKIGLHDTQVAPLSLTTFEGQYYSPDPSEKLVGLSFTASIRPMSASSFSIPFSFSVIAPKLAAEEPNNIGAPINPTDSYDCCGQKGDTVTGCTTQTYNQRCAAGAGACRNTPFCPQA